MNSNVNKYKALSIVLVALGKGKGAGSRNLYNRDLIHHGEHDFNTVRSIAELYDHHI